MQTQSVNGALKSMPASASHFVRLITLQDPNTRVVLLGAGVLGLAAGVIGAFAVLRRRALVGDALAHAALPGICVAFLIAGDRNFAALLGGALVFGILGVLTISFLRAHTRIKEDAAIGIVLSTFFGLGIALSGMIQRMKTGSRAGLDTYLFGKAAAMIRQDVLFIGIVAVVVIIAVALLVKEFRMLCFDRDFAAAQGWPVLRLDVALMGLLCVTTVIGLPAVGVVLMSAMLIIPAAAARFWTDRLVTMLVLSGVFGAIGGFAGVAISTQLEDAPAGPLVVLAVAGIFLVSMLAAPRRGILADTLRRATMRRRMADQHLLRAMYEITERRHLSAQPAETQRGAGMQSMDARAPHAVSMPELLRWRAWPAPTLLSMLQRGLRMGWIARDKETYHLTDAGRVEAVRVVRAHRLWESFLIDQAAIAPDHVDRDADDIEHYLPPDIIAQLEQRLRRDGRLPEDIPASPHPTGGLPG